MEDFKARTGVYHQELEQLRQLEEQSHIEVEAKINALTVGLPGYGGYDYLFFLAKSRSRGRTRRYR